MGAIVYFAFLRVPYRPLFTDVRSADAATIVAELDKKKIPYRLKDGGATILVPANLVDATRLDVMNDDLPIKGSVGFELFNKSDMGLTEFAQKINYQRALQGELARTIMTLDAVDSARVHLSMPEPSVFRDDRIPPKASATIITRPGKQLSAGAVAGIRRLIAAAVPDLDVGDVVILDERGELLVGDASPAANASLSPDLQQEHALEQYYAAQVRQALHDGYPRAEVTVTIPPQLGTPDAPDDVRAMLSQWTPTTRRFRLSVAVSTVGALGVGQETALRDLVQRTLGRSTNQVADDIAISPAGPASETADDAVSPDVALAVRRAALAGGAGQDSNLAMHAGPPSIFWVAAALLVPLIFVAGFLARRSAPAARALSEQERLAYVERLRERLAKGADGVGLNF